MPNGEMFVEKRKNERAEIKFKIVYKVLPSVNFMATHPKNGISRDVSVGGVRILGEPVGEAGDVIKIDIPVEGRDPVSTFAEIRWVKGQGPAAEFGVQFLMLKESDADLLERVINAD